MKISTLTDSLALVGLALIGAGLYQVRPFLVAIFAGALLIGLARSLATREYPAVAEKEEN